MAKIAGGVLYVYVGLAELKGWWVGETLHKKAGESGGCEKTQWRPRG